MNLNTKRVLALDLRPRSFGFVVFENAELLDWGVKSLRDLAGRQIPAGIRLAPLLTELQPAVVLLKSTMREKLRREPHVEDVLDTIEYEGKGRIAVRLISSQQIRRMFPGSVHNKDDLAACVAARFSDLAWKLPPRRKFPYREHYRMSIFDAASLALAYYRTP
jgi:hypothetical protein